MSEITISEDESKALWERFEQDKTDYAKEHQIAYQDYGGEMAIEIYDGLQQHALSLAIRREREKLRQAQETIAQQDCLIQSMDALMKAGQHSYYLPLVQDKLQHERDVWEQFEYDRRQFTSLSPNLGDRPTKMALLNAVDHATAVERERQNEAATLFSWLLKQFRTASLNMGGDHQHCFNQGRLPRAPSVLEAIRAGYKRDQEDRKDANERTSD